MRRSGYRAAGSWSDLRPISARSSSRGRGLLCSHLISLGLGLGLGVGVGVGLGLGSGLGSGSGLGLGLGVGTAEPPRRLADQSARLLDTLGAQVAQLQAQRLLEHRVEQVGAPG